MGEERSKKQKRRMKKSQGRWTCACCAAALLTGHDAAATATATRATAEQAPFLDYKLETNVDEIAALDLDQRSIVARLATGDEEGLTEAQEVYTKGRNLEEEIVTIRDLSVKAGELLSNSSTYNTFVDFYGGSDYADRWATSSFTGGATGGDFYFDFSQFDVEGRAAAIRFGIPIVHVWMFVVGLLEKAVSSCQGPGDTTDSGGTGGRRTQTTSSSSNMESIVDWDKAVAIYTGSEPRENGIGGYFIYSLVKNECVKFGTCRKGDMAPVNTIVFDSFINGKKELLVGNCQEAKDHANSIKTLMIVPIIQGLIRAVYALDVQNDFQETTQGMGAAYASAILPLVSKCNEGNAVVIYNDLKPGNSLKGSYEVVKASLERSYECLGINCEHVGGLVNFRGDGYLLGAEACHGLLPVTSDEAENENGSSSDSTSPNSHLDSDDVIEDVDQPVEVTGRDSNAAVETASAVLIFFGILNFFFCLWNAWLYTMYRRKSEKEIDTGAAGSAVSEPRAEDNLPPKSAFAIIIDDCDKDIV